MNNTPFTVVVRCSDPRIDGFFSGPDALQTLGLDLEQSPGAVAFISNVGGAMHFADSSALDLVSDVSLLVGAFGEGRSRVILTAHSQCAGYANTSGARDEEPRCRQSQDLVHLTEKLLAADLPIDVAAFFLDLQTGSIEPVVPDSC